MQTTYTDDLGTTMEVNDSYFSSHDLASVLELMRSAIDLHAVLVANILRHSDIDNI